MAKKTPPTVEPLLDVEELDEARLLSLAKNLVYNLDLDSANSLLEIEREKYQRKARGLSADVKARVAIALPDFVLSDDALLQKIYEHAHYYLQSERRSRVEEITLKEWSTLLRGIFTSYRKSVDDGATLLRRMHVFKRGFPPNHEVLAALKNAEVALEASLQANNKAIYALLDLADEIPMGKDMGSDPLSKRLRGGHPVEKFGEMVALAYDESGYDIESGEVGFWDTFRRLYNVLLGKDLSDECVELVDLPSESKTVAAIRSRIRRRLGAFRGQIPSK